ncbi:MAG TPA: sulfatase-like hydrolase/transferase, partial [Leptolinea sp.]
TMGSSTFQYAGLLEDIRLSDRNFGNREQVPFTPHANPVNNIILIIDESLRADHLSINSYDRDTTPTLMKLSEKGLLTNWGIAVASATCSIISNPHILTGVPSESGIDSRLTSSWPTIFQYARAMGYRTYYLDAQESFLWNGLLSSDLKFVDVHLTTQEFGKDNKSDQQAAKFIRKEILNSTGNFIVLNKMGMHILYENNYPPSEADWLPTPPESNYKKFPSLVINAYDNAIHYNLESFFQTLMPDLEELPDTFLIYTSDHGDTLQEHGETWSHCHNTDPEAKVPLFIVGKLDFMPDTQYKASHANIMPTILDLMHVPQGIRSQIYAPSLLTAQHTSNKPRYFLDGDLESILFGSD